MAAISQLSLPNLMLPAFGLPGISWYAKNMEITVKVPDDFAAPLLPPGEDPARAALEALALQAFRERRLTGFQLRTLLGIASRYELDGFLKEHAIEKYTAEDFEYDLETLSTGLDKAGHPA
jgi:hypothetical protein